MTQDGAHLLDREQEITSVERLLDDAGAAAGRFLAVCGGAGCGRTAVLHEAAIRARERGYTVLPVRGSHAELDLPFGLVWRLFEPVLPTIAESARAELAARVPASGTLLDSGPDNPPDASLAQMYALHQALAELAAAGPVLVVVDDVQWADRPSLRWLAALPQRLANAPAALLVSACDGAPSADPALLDELLAASAVQLRPAGLGPDAVTDLLGCALGAPPDPAFAAACLDATAGSPSLLTGLAATLAEQEVAPTAAEVSTPAELTLPGLARTTHVWLRRVSPHGLTIARTVGVLGAAATPDRIAEVAGVDSPTVRETVTSLARMGLFGLSRGTVEFTQPLVRTAVMNEAPFVALQRVRAQAARLLYDSGAADEVVAEQLLAAAPLGETWVPDLLRRVAALAIGAGRPENAVACLHQVLAEPIGADVRAAVLVELSRAEAHTDLAAAIRHLTQGGGDAGELARLHSLSGQDEAAVALLDGLPTDDPGALELRLAVAATAGGALAALDGARPPDGTDRARVLGLLATRATWVGEHRDSAVELAERTLAGSPCGPTDVAGYLRAVLVLAQAGRAGDAIRHADAAVDAGQRWQHGPCLAAAYSVRAEVARGLGRLAAATADARAGLDLLVRCGADPRRGTAMVYLARLVQVLVDQGDHDAAARLLDRADLTAEAPDTWAGVALLLARARVRLADGLPAGAVDDLHVLAGRLDAWSVHNPAVMPWRSIVATALYRLGDKADARRHALREVELARRWGAPAPLAAALRVQAMVVRGPVGLALLEEAASLVDGSPYRLEAARCLVAYGAALRRARRTTSARQTLHTALDLAQECGAPMLSEQARTELTAAGGRRRETVKSGVASLTAAEYRAAALAADGQKTIREIAASLYVTRRTIEIHLANTYRKLGIHGRAQLLSALPRPSARPAPPTTRVGR